MDSGQARVGLDQLESAVGELPNVLGTTQELSPDGRVALVRVQYPEIGELAASDLDALKTVVADARASSSLRLEAGGDLYFSFEQPPANVSELIGLVVAAVILLVAFGSLLAAGLPLAVALFGLLVGASLIPLIGLLVDVPVWAPVIGAMVGLGVGIDYALFLVSRHREFLAAGLPVGRVGGPGDGDRRPGRGLRRRHRRPGDPRAGLHGAAVHRGGRGRDLGDGDGDGAGVDHPAAGSARAGREPGRSPDAAPVASRSPIGAGGRGRRPTLPCGGGRAGGAHVSRHAVAYAVAGTTLMLALAAPVMALRLGLRTGLLPAVADRRQAYDLIAEGFGPGRPARWSSRWTSPGPVGRGAAGAGAGRRPGVASAVVAPRPGSEVAVIIAGAHDLSAGRGDRADAGAAALSVPGRAGRERGEGTHRWPRRRHVRPRPPRPGPVPVLVVAVVSMSFLLLMVLFRSVLVPLKAAVMNLLSITAAYGVLTVVLQWGWGGEPVRLRVAMPVTSLIPVFLFVILFGLSMDYEVFLLSRVRESYLGTGDNDEAVVPGWCRRGAIRRGRRSWWRCSWGSGSATTRGLKKVGLGLAVAVLLDATFVRLMLVPATMKLLGDGQLVAPRVAGPAVADVGLEGAGAERPAHQEPDPELALTTPSAV